MKYLIACVVALLISVPAKSYGECVTQDYAKTVEPNYDCPGPGEDTVVPQLKYKLSVGLDKDKAAPFAGILFEPNQVLQLGLRIKGLRRLRYIEQSQTQARIKVEVDFTKSMAAAESKLLENQRDGYKGQLIDTRKELDSERAWYRSWSFGFVLGTAVTCAAAVSLAVAVK